jgi:hypothetical protein
MGKDLYQNREFQLAWITLLIIKNQNFKIFQKAFDCIKKRFITSNFGGKP